MKLFKIATMTLSSAMLLTIFSGAFAQPLNQASKEIQDVSVTLDGQTTYFTGSEIERMAELNNVDPYALREAIESGPDEEGRFSPFSKLPQLKNGISQEQLAENDKQKFSSTGEPIFKPKTGESVANPMAKVTKSNQDSTAYNWTGKRTANGNWPVLGICAVHRVKDISGGTSNSPVIPFRTVLDIIGVDIWLPDGYGYEDQFIVDDTGLGPNKTDYWIDIYYSNDTNSALAYGVRKLSYSYTN